MSTSKGANQGDRKGRPGILEQDLAQRWHALPLAQSLPLISGEACCLLYAGRSGGPQGPDVRDAVLQFAPEHADTAEGRITGDVEFHIRCSDWYAHQHHTDPRYNNVILHIVLIFDSAGPVLRLDGRAVPVCSLNDLVPAIFPQPLWPCQCILPSMSGEARSALLQHAGMLRFEQKTQHLLAQLGVSQPHIPFSAYDVCLIPALIEAMGYGRDRAFFRAIGQRLVGLSSEIPEPAGRAAEPSPLDAGRLRASGKLVEQWRTNGVWETIKNAITSGGDVKLYRTETSDGEPSIDGRGRPQGSPPLHPATPAPTMTGDGRETDRSHGKGGGGVGMGGDPCGRPRTEQHIGPIQVGMGGDPCGRPRSSIVGLIDRQTTTIITNLRSIFSDIGPARADILICNVVLPFAAAVADIEQDRSLLEKAQELYRAYPALTSNQVTRSMYRQLGLEHEPRNACQQQGLHYIYAQTCREKQCAACIVVGRNA